jgi:hypothetical protein
MGTHWELEGNIMGTHWEQGIFKKKTFSPPTKLLNEKSKPP